MTGKDTNDNKANLETLGFSPAEMVTTHRKYASERNRLDYARALLSNSGRDVSITYDPHGDEIKVRKNSGTVRLDAPELLISARPWIGEHAESIPEADLKNAEVLQSVAGNHVLPDLDDLPIIDRV